jgi:probable RNA-binding protein EIF1AD
MGRPKRLRKADTLSAGTPPDSLPASHFIAKVVGGRGNSLFAVTLPQSKSNTEEQLVELDGKLRNTVYLRRGGYVLVDGEALNTDRDNKLGGVIVGVVMDEKAWRKMPYWYVLHTT